MNELLELFGYPSGSTLQDLLVHCLLGLFLFGTVLLGLLIESLFGLCLFLVMLLGWLLLRFRLFRLKRLRLPDGIFIGLVVLDLAGKEFDQTEKPQHTSWEYLCMLVNVCGRGCITGVSGVDCKRRRCNQHDLEDSPVHPRTGRLILPCARYAECTYTRIQCLSPRKSTTRFAGHRFFRGKVTIFIGRETKTHILSTKINETIRQGQSPSRVINHSTTRTIIQSGEAPFSHARSLHPTLGS